MRPCCWPRDERMKRRDFLKYLGSGIVGTGVGLAFGKVTKPPGAKLIPYLIPPEDVIPGVATWYASLCTQCSAGCGILVKVMEGRAKKIEGNPLHPVNKGRLCARGNAALQALYNPDRIKGPMKRTGERGSGKYKEISWNEAISILGRNLSELDKNGATEGLYVLTSTLRGHLNTLIREFMSSYGSPNYMQYELFQHRNLIYANRVSMGLDAIPHYDIANTRYLLSFGADFSSTWLSPVNLSHGYGEMRQGGARRRGVLVQVEPRLSLTGANADEWVPVRPGTEGVLALSIAHEIVAGGYYKGADASSWKELLSGFSPEHAARVTEVDAGRIHHIAKEFVKTRPSLAIGGDNLSSYRNGLSSLVAVNILNHLAGNIGRKGGVVPNPAGLLNGRTGTELRKDRITDLAKSALEGDVKTLIVYNTNPVFTTPAGVKLERALRNVPFIASLSSFMDETTAMADLILPSHTSLEDWGDDFAEPSTGVRVATLMQPAVSPVFDTRGAGDIFISLAKALGGKVGERLNYKGFPEYLKESWRKIYANNKEVAAGALTFDGFWNRLLEHGGWWQTEEPRHKPRSVSVRRVKAHIPTSPSEFEGDEGRYPLYLVTYPHAGYLDGRGANLPWLQEMPDPMTAVVWGSWVEINPKTARKLGIKQGDLVTVESPYGGIDLPAFLYEGIRPDTVAVPIGQGHRLYGRYAEKRGVNPIEILPVAEDKRSGELALNSTRVRLERKGADGKLVKMGVRTEELGRGIVQTITPEEFERIAGKEEA